MAREIIKWYSGMICQLHGNSICAMEQSSSLKDRFISLNKEYSFEISIRQSALIKSNSEEFNEHSFCFFLIFFYKGKL